jgi:iron complex transport system substrate-binding protein
VANSLIRILICSVLLAGCRRGESGAVQDTGPRDDYGTRLAIGAPPKRIVSLNPTTTEILFAIGAGKLLVGRSQYDTFPDSAKLVPSLGPALRPSVEAIIGAKPDLVILYASEDNRAVFDRLRQASIQTVAFKLDSIEQFRRDTQILGRLVGDTVSARIVVDSVSATLDRVRRATSSLPRPSVFLPTWYKPIIAIGGGSFMSELLDIAGAKNVYASVPTPTATVTLEDVVSKNPDVVIVGAQADSTIQTSPMWRTVPAVRDNRVKVVDFDLVSRPSVQLGAAAVALAKLLHPGALP